jgi:hypothetical protein
VTAYLQHAFPAQIMRQAESGIVVLHFFKQRNPSRDPAIVRINALPPGVGDDFVGFILDFPWIHLIPDNAQY